MVTVGGSDPLNLMPIILEELRDSGLRIKAVVGAQFKKRKRLERPDLARRINSMGIPAGGCSSGAVELMENPDMAELMRWADVAVSAGGSTLYELCATGTPAVALATAGNQVSSACALSERGCVWYLGFYNEVLKTGPGAAGRQNHGRVRQKSKDCSEELNLRQAVEALAADYGRRAKMSLLGQALVDGRGAERSAAVIREMISSRVS